MRLTIVTNSLSITNLLGKFENIRLIVVGGFYSPKEQAFYGSSAQDAIEKYYVDKAFLSCRSLSIENGITDSYDQWAQVRKTIIERSKERYLLADFSKFNQTSFMRVCGFEKINAIITDKPLGPEWHTAMRKYGCRVLDGVDDGTETSPSDDEKKR
jgi:DeoR/GlpR family transcriptional regulator of sugar metabolism